MYDAWLQEKHAEELKKSLKGKHSKKRLQVDKDAEVDDYMIEE